MSYSKVVLQLGRAIIGFLAIMLATCFICASSRWFSQAAWAYVDIFNISSGSITCEYGNEYTIQGSTSSSHHVTIKGSQYADSPTVVTIRGLYIDSSGDDIDAADAPITVESGYALLKVQGECTLKAGRDKRVGNDYGKAGISVNESAHLTIVSDGSFAGSESKLTVTGGDNGSLGGSGIGSNYNEDSGYITIESGTIVATGGACAAGIGSGRDGICKSVTITGGNVTATGKGKAAGIGGGNEEGSGDGGHTNNVTITGGTIVAYGGSDGSDGGAGVGGSNGDLESVNISGGTIEAHGGNGAAGVGGGADAHVGNLVISNATIKAYGGKNAAGIGAGDSQGTGDGGDMGDITITNCTIEATGGEHGAGIGGSNDGTVGHISITGGTVTAVGGNGATGIGGGRSVNTGDGGDFDSITIKDSDNIDDARINVTATGTGEDAAGIGSAGCTAGPITINLAGGCVTANGAHHSAGIGAGGKQNGHIKITGSGTINANSGFDAAAIGAGKQHHAAKIEILGDDKGGSAYGDDAVYALVVNCTQKSDTGSDPDSNAAMIGSGDGTSEDIVIKNANLSLQNNSPRAHGAGIGTGNSADMSSHDGGISKIQLDHCKVRSNGAVEMAAGIGAGASSTIDHIKLTEVDYEGATIGSCTKSGVLHDQGDVKSIEISRSKIVAHALNWNKNGLDDASPLAGIGTGPYGGIDSITIANSDVEAYGAYGGAGIGTGGLTYSTGSGPQDEASFREAWNQKGKVGSIEITGSKITAQGSKGGAGIGGGNTTSVEGGITISSSEVTATGVNGDTIGGCGIGAGAMCSGGDISIINGSKVKATGGKYCAGVGSSGYSQDYIFADYLKEWWNETVGAISVRDSVVEAYGGEFAAGIGGGECTHCDDAGTSFVIDNSTVRAVGGKYGAGIGAGPEFGILQMGGDARNISITGTSKVDASGGEGGAGIGGGFSGNVNGVTIDLTQDPSNYVKATGGAGAAGIGGGTCCGDRGSQGQDGKNIVVNSGFVWAIGGADWNSDYENNSQAHPGGFIGAGAGIGGGSSKGYGDVKINGGVVVAQAGTAHEGNHAAEDIGCGGDNYQNDNQAGSSDVSINAGSVVAKLPAKNTTKVNGGSIQCQIGGKNADSAQAQNSDGKRVYQTTLTLDTTGKQRIDFAGKVFYQVEVASLSDNGYGVKDVYALESGENRAKTYFYFAPTEENEAKAEIAWPSSSASEKLKYFGTTKSGTNENVMKMGSALQFTCDPSTPEAYVGLTFKLKVSAIGTNWTSGNLTYSISNGTDVVKINETQSTTTAPVSKLALDCLKAGSFKVKASLGEGFEPDLYWEASAEYSGTVRLEHANISIDEDISKAYDGTSDNERPSITLVDEAGAIVDPDSYQNRIQYTYKTSLGEALDGEPKEPGTYEVTVTVPSDGTLETASAISNFTISPRPLTLSLMAGGNAAGEGAKVVVPISNGIPELEEQTVKLTITLPDGQSSLGSQQVASESTASDLQSQSDPQSEEIRDGSSGKRSSANDGASEPSATTSVDTPFEGDQIVSPTGKEPESLNMQTTPSELSAQAIGNLSAQGGSNTITKQAPIKKYNGAYYAVADFEIVPAGEFLVTASMDNPHFTVQPVEGTFTKSMHPWTILCADVTLALDAQPYDLNPTVLDVHGDSASNAYISYELKEGDDVIAIDEQGRVTVKKAGSAKVKISVDGNANYSESSAVTMITVTKGIVDLSVTCPDKQYDGKPVSAQVECKAEGYPVDYAEQPVVRYYKRNGDRWTLLDEAPSEVGSYVVLVTAAGDDNFDAAATKAKFEITSVPEVKPDDDNGGGSSNGGNDGSVDQNTVPGSPTSTPSSGDRTALQWMPLFVATALFSGLAVIYALGRYRDRRLISGREKIRNRKH